MRCNVERHQGFAEIDLPLFCAETFVLYDTVPIKLRHGYAVYSPLRLGGQTPSGLHVLRQEGIPALFGLVVAVAPYTENGDELADDQPDVGDVIHFKPYSSEPFTYPSPLWDAALEHLPPMERTNRGLWIIDCCRIEAILEREEDSAAQRNGTLTKRVE